MAGAYVGGALVAGSLSLALDLLAGKAALAGAALRHAAPAAVAALDAERVRPAGGPSRSA
jgi:hypothetical protein